MYDVPSSLLQATELAETLSWRAIEKAVEHLGTPLYVYVPGAARMAYARLRAGAERWGTCRIAYSLKTNPFHALLNEIRAAGSWIEVVSEWEFEIALAAGFSPAQIIFNGPLKPGPVLKRAADKKVFTINIDSREELATVVDLPVNDVTARIGVGVRLCLPGESGALSLSRFGIQVETGEADEAVRTIQKCPRLRLNCIHVHLGTQITSSDRYVKALSYIQSLWQRLHLDADVWLDIGGGYPYQHDTPSRAQQFQPEVFFASLQDAWRFETRPPLLLEPGRWLAAPSFAVVSRVLAIKARTGEPAIVVLDSGTNHNVMGAFYEHLWHFHQTGPEEEFRICGPLCMEDDILSGPMIRPRPSLGSLVSMGNAGAYSVSMARAFIQPRPAVVRLTSDEGYELLTPREVLSHAYGVIDSRRRRDADTK